MAKTAGQRLRDYRVNNGYTVEALAKILGKHKNHICAMQSGRRKPGRALAAQIETLTGIKIPDWDK